MNEFGIFLFESGISLSVLYVFYWFLLRKETWFSLNRIILISTLLLALVIPFIRITFSGSTEQDSIIYAINRLIMDPLVVTRETIYAKIYQTISLIHVIYFIYFTGVIFFSLKLLGQFLQIYGLIKRYGKTKHLGYTIVPIDKNLSPFSFFNLIFINSGRLNKKDLKNILHHEGEHAKKLHTLDIILLEVLCIIQWFNPFIWLYKFALREVHEFEADLKVIKSGENKVNYQQLILEQILGNQFIHVVHNLINSSLIKKRITMMTKKESKRRTIIKSLLILPLAAILVTIFSCTQENDLKDLDNLNEKDLNIIESTITQDQDTTFAGEVFFIVEEMPTFMGQELNGFRNWVLKQLVYPEAAAKKGIEGTVYVQFIVEPNGLVNKATIMRGVDPLLDAEALRVVKASPQWKPGKQRGKEVNVAFTFPIKFVLQ